MEGDKKKIDPADGHKVGSRSQGKPPYEKPVLIKIEEDLQWSRGGVTSPCA